MHTGGQVFLTQSPMLDPWSKVLEAAELSLPLAGWFDRPTYFARFCSKSAELVDSIAIKRGLVFLMQFAEHLCAYRDASTCAWKQCKQRWSPASSWAMVPVGSEIWRAAFGTRYRLSMSTRPSTAGFGSQVVPQAEVRSPSVSWRSLVSNSLDEFGDLASASCKSLV